MMLKLKLQYVGHLMWRNRLLRKDPDDGKDWRQEERGTTEDEVVAWHHQLNGHEFEQAPGVGDGQGGLVCCNPCGHKESDMLSDWNGLNYLTTHHSSGAWMALPEDWGKVLTKLYFFQLRSLWYSFVVLSKRCDFQYSISF